MRLVSYNIHKGIGGNDRRYSLDRTIAVLRELQPDIMCLQEVTIDLPRTGRHDQAGLLADKFESMTAVFQQNVKWKVGGYGNLVLSNLPVQDHHRISLRFEKKKPRGAQLLVLDAPHGALRLVNWHLGLSERERHWQVSHLLHHEIWHATAEFRTLIAGDFNDWRNQLGRQLLEHHGFHHASAPPSRFRSFPAIMPVMSLDKVYHRPGIVIDHISVCNTRLTRQASDHLPLIVDFHLTHHSE